MSMEGWPANQMESYEGGPRRIVAQRGRKLAPATQRQQWSMKSLVDILVEARILVAREGNDFSWSGWDDNTEALAEIDAILTQLKAGRIPGPAMNLLFLPTGPLQELSLSSVWGEEFVALAGRFDHALASVDPSRLEEET